MAHKECRWEPLLDDTLDAVTTVGSVLSGGLVRALDLYLAGASQVGLGLRAENEVDGVFDWGVVLLDEMPFVPVNGPALAWPLPDGSAADSTWIRGEGLGRQIPTASAFAREAAGQGKQGRIHTCR